MKSDIRRILIVITAGLILLVVLEAGVYNWRLLLSMRYKALSELSVQLQWRRDELLVERAMLLNPGRLEAAGEELGLSPLPLQNFTVVQLQQDSTGGDFRVCMEQ